MTARMKTGTFNVDVRSQLAYVTREFEFVNGDKISFTVSIPTTDAELSLKDLHKASIKVVVDALNATVPPQD